MVQVSVKVQSRIFTISRRRCSICWKVLSEYPPAQRLSAYNEAMSSFCLPPKQSKPLSCHQAEHTAARDRARRDC